MKSKTNRFDRTRYQGEKHTFDTSTPTVLKCGTYTFFYMNTMLPLIYCLFLYINVASSELIWVTTREDGSKLLNRTGRVSYV